MKKWECIVCGYVYDEAVGAPDDGVPPRTRWEDVPEDWLCPDCGVGKEDFEPVDEPALPAAVGPAAGEGVVVIGTGLAGYHAAKEFRKRDADSPLRLLTADDGRLYSKPMLSTGFTRDTDADALAQAEPDAWASQLNARVDRFVRVCRLEPDARCVALESGERIGYDRLVLAWGSDVIVPPLGGDALDLVYSVNDLMDYDRFRRALAERSAKRLVIIGAGLIGSEFANDLRNGGFELEVVDPLGYVLPTLLPEPAGLAVQRAMERAGVRFHFGPLVTSVSRRGRRAAVALSNGEELVADVVVRAVGVRPRVALAEQAGLAVRRGIVVNRRLETSASGIYALGDCAEVDGHVLFYVAPLMACARALGKTLSGEPTEVSYPAMPVTIKTPLCPVVVSPPAADAAGEWRCEVDGDDVLAEFLAPNGALLGFALTGARVSEKLRLQRALPPLLA